jgi:hypothetical protein
MKLSAESNVAQILPEWGILQTTILQDEDALGTHMFSGDGNLFETIQIIMYPDSNILSLKPSQIVQIDTYKPEKVINSVIVNRPTKTTVLDKGETVYVSPTPKSGKTFVITNSIPTFIKQIRKQYGANYIHLAISGFLVSFFGFKLFL